MPLYIEKEKEATTLSEEYPDAGFIVIPNSIERRTDIDFTDKHIYGLIFSFTANGQVFYGSNGYIQRRLGMSARTVAKSLKNLEDKKLIQRTIVNRNERNVYANIEGGDMQSLHRGDMQSLGIYNIQEDKQVDSSTPPTNTKNTNKKTVRLKSSKSDITSTTFKEYLEHTVPFSNYMITEDYLVRLAEKIDAWATSKGKIVKDWKATARNWLLSDIDAGKFQSSRSMPDITELFPELKGKKI